MEDRKPRALDAEWQRLLVGPSGTGKTESMRIWFYGGAGTVHRLVQDCIKRAAANRREGESEHETAMVLLEDIRLCLLDTIECVDGFMNDQFADIAKRARARPDDAEAMEMRRRLAEWGFGTPRAG
jgi:hypothetical protein